MTYPAVPRALAAAGAVGTALWFGALQPLGLAAVGCPTTAFVALVAVLPLVAFLALLAAAPGVSQGILARWTRIDLRDGGHVGATILLAGALYFIVGWGGLVTATGTVEDVLTPCSLLPEGPTRGEDVLLGVTLTFAILTIPILLYVAFVHGHGPAGTLRALGLRSEDAPRALAIGVAAAVLFIVALGLAASAVATRLPQDALQNDKALEIARSVTVLGAIGIAVASGLGEELFFRGFLQPRVGIIASSVVFALAHFGYGSASEVVVVFTLSLGLGLLFRFTKNLWAPVATHFTFNLIMLIAGQYLPDAV